MSHPQQRPDPQLDDLVHRLRVRPLSSWQHSDRRERTSLALQQLADLAAAADSRLSCPVPELSPMAFADQLAVLGREAMGADAVAAQTILLRLAADLGARG